MGLSSESPAGRPRAKGPARKGGLEALGGGRSSERAALLSVGASHLYTRCGAPE